MEKEEVDGLHRGGDAIPKTGYYFNAGRGYGVHGGARLLEAGDKFPRLRTGCVWKFLGTEKEIGPQPKRRHKA